MTATDELIPGYRIYMKRINYKFPLYKALLTLWLTMIALPSLLAQEVYQYSEQNDAYIIGLGVPLALFGISLDLSLPPLSEADALTVKSEQLNPLDRLAVSNYSENSARLSDILLASCVASPLLLLFSDQIRQDADIVYGMYLQSLLFGASLPSLAKGAFRRPRPYVYNPDVPLAKKLETDARKSFFSGHTSIAFTSMVFLSTVYSRYYPQADSRTYLWFGSVLLASTVGYLRIDAGSHFPTDVLTGALVGGLIGYIIPKIHEVEQQDAPAHLSNSLRSAPILQLEFTL